MALVINWEMFGAGMALIGAAVAFIFLNGILGTFGRNVSVPGFIPTTLFVIGVLVLLESVGIITDLNSLLLAAVGNSNIPEFILGMVVVVFALYEKLYEKLGFKPSGFVRVATLIFGVLLILDGLRIVPIIYYISEIIAYAIYGVLSILVAYSWAGSIVLIAVILAIAYLWIKVKRGGVPA